MIHITLRGKWGTERESTEIVIKYKYKYIWLLDSSWLDILNGVLCDLWNYIVVATIDDGRLGAVDILLFSVLENDN